MGDLRLFSKIYLNPESHGIRIAFIPELKLPTGSAELFVSDVSTGYGALVAVEKDFGFLSASINAGYRRSSNALFRNIDFRQQIPLGAGASIPVTHKLSANLEVSRVQSFPTDQVENPSEIYAGLRYAVLPGVSALGGASLGATNSASSGNYRVLVGLKYIPFFDRTSGLVVAPQIAPSVPAVVETPIKTTQAKAVFNPAEIEIRGDIKFQHNSAILKAQAKTILNDVAQVILENRANFELIEIQGHCNRLGPDLYNLKLSKRRAEAVKSYLVTKGVESNLLAARGFGKRIPKEPPPPLSPTQHLSADRRVQFKVIHAKAHTPG